MFARRQKEKSVERLVQSKVPQPMTLYMYCTFLGWQTRIGLQIHFSTYRVIPTNTVVARE